MSADPNRSATVSAVEAADATILDVRGLRCPLPVLRARKAMQGVPPGDVLTVLATDPAAVIDFPHFCHQAGLELLATQRDGDVLRFLIRKPASAGASEPG